ncbi:hypothetical protein QUA07_28235 [Microcoleus sp. T3_A4]
MDSVRIQNLLDRTATDGGNIATDIWGTIRSPKNSAEIALYSFFKL